jgi:hypothetical protein
MEISYEIKELDAMMRACVEFTDAHDPVFDAGQIAGRIGDDTDAYALKRMMEWVSKLDSGLFESLGPDKHNVTCFRLGPDAKKMIARGGFRTYFSRFRGQSLT